MAHPSIDSDHCILVAYLNGYTIEKRKVSIGVKSSGFSNTATWGKLRDMRIALHMLSVRHIFVLFHRKCYPVYRRAEPFSLSSWLKREWHEPFAVVLYLPDDMYALTVIGIVNIAVVVTYILLLHNEWVLIRQRKYLKGTCKMRPKQHMELQTQALKNILTNDCNGSEKQHMSLASLIVGSIC